MNNLIDKKLFTWFLSIDDTEEIYAQDYGSFSIERMDFRISMSDDEWEKFNKAEKIMFKNNGIPPNDVIANDYYKPIQAHNHELFHFYQALSLPAFNIYQKLTKRVTEFESATMLRYFEYGYSYTLMKNKKILEALENPLFVLPEDEQLSCNKLILNYKFYKEQWNSKYQNISLFYIIEGMAHIMSMQLTFYSNNYLLETNNKIEYNIAYDVYYSYIDNKYKEINIRIKHLIFLYICYFSCQTYSFMEDEVLEKTSRLFYTLSSRINLYLETFITLVERYTKYSKNELEELNQFDINQEDIKISNKNQLCNIYALFELIPIIEQDAEKLYHPKIKISTDIPKEYLVVLKEKLGIDLLSKFQLANFALFPVRMADMWEAYDIIQKLRIGENKFKNEEESAFYEFIANCKNLLSSKYLPILCCEEHGRINNKLKVLYCKNEGSFAYSLRELIKKEPFDVFKIMDG